MIRTYIQQIINATNKCINEIQREWYKVINSGRKKATRKNFYKK